MDKRELTKKIILYLIYKLEERIEGKKKLMKLMFLVEHYDPIQNRLIRQKNIGNTFYIYYYGVFSREVMECYNKLVKEGKIVDSFPIKFKQYALLEQEIKDLDEKIKERIDKIISLFGNRTGYSLENETLKMMGIQPYEKESYWGREVSEIIAPF